MPYSPEGLKDAPAPDPTGSAAPTDPTGSTAPTRRGGLGLTGWLRWMWRQLTSMRVALMLLLLLAVVALPGSFFPQTPQNPTAVSQYLRDHPTSGPWLEQLGFFDVYSSPWFSAVYLLLFTSLIGCIVPRVGVHLRSLRTPAPAVPRRLTRFPVREQYPLAADPATAQARAAHVLRRSKIATREEPGGVLTVSSETGYGRETGNIVFHLALVGVLMTMAWGQLVHYRGQAVVVEGHSFVNAPLDYNSFDSGALFAEGDLEPFRFTLEDFSSQFTIDARARDFQADVTVTTPDGHTSSEQVKVNDPMAIDNARVYLMGNGYAPDLEVTDASGQVAYSGPVPFLPQNSTYMSTGVVSVPDANAGKNQLGFRGTFLPSAIPSSDGAFAGSAHPDPLDPVLVLELWEGDLGLDEGVPKSLMQLDTTNMEQVMTPSSTGSGELVPYRAVLRPGESVDLPGGRGTVTFTDLPRYVALDLRYDPSIVWMGVFAGLAFAGLIGSLFLRRRRIWIRLAPAADGTTMVEAAALARGDDPGLARALDRVLTAMEPKDE
ncbi:cytochrome c biogenesis protein ResB [Pseudactinotalea sp. HY158]|uniref:cytochrome c biogenesis protein ResB n=1 Tax=Pseudactinotalea sp. HY158 TaxID=2654547 RepID=UPI00129C88E9|nr:cytochrome c biogenesis protein ResB [Pseudactinotalea sp. HY158]QGH70497.1 cytochrome c biogenesis protein ResB [Pseudactinotalea sp. HY158]